MAMETKPEISTDEVVERGQKIYRDVVRPQLTEVDKGKYITIDVETDEWLMGQDRTKLSQKARNTFIPGNRRYGLKAGWTQSVSFRTGTKRPLAEW